MADEKPKEQPDPRRDESKFGWKAGDVTVKPPPSPPFRPLKPAKP